MCMFDSCVPELTFYYISTIYKDTISELGNTAASTFPPSCGLKLLHCVNLHEKIVVASTDCRPAGTRMSQMPGLW